MSEDQRKDIKDMMQELLNKCYQLVRADDVWQVQTQEGKVIQESSDYGFCFNFIKEWEEEKCKFLGKWF